MTPQPGFRPFVGHLGHGPRKVLALHCNLGHSGAWSGFVQALDGLVSVVAPDMPSNGCSPDWDGKSDFPETVYAAARDQLTEPMDVVGHSFGAAVAMRIAVEHPELVRSLTMIESVFFRIVREDEPEAMVAHDADAAPTMAALFAGDYPLAARLFNRMWSGGAKWDDMPEKLRRVMIRAVPVVRDAGHFLYDDTAGMMPKLGAIRCPVLLVHGAQTEPVVKITHAGLARRIPGAVACEVAGAGHMVPITHPAPVAALWRTHIAERC